MKTLEYKLFFVNVIFAIFITIFSYAYVDLNLTLSRNDIFLSLVGKLQYLGYYLRPQATAIYIVSISGFFTSFAINVFLFYKEKLSLKYLFLSLAFIIILLIPAYPFLSSDIFNYMFDAKIITHYHLSPYTHKPLDFPTDDWLRFMRWVHRYSPYGPLWLAYSIIPSALGFGKFLLTFFMFKLFIGLFHFLNSWVVYKTMQKIKSKYALVATAFYALNPLFLLEGVVNAHNDVIHAFFILLSIYFLAQKSYLKSLISIILSGLIKYLALLSLAPLTFFRINKNRGLSFVILFNLVLYALFTFLFSTFRITVPFISAGSLQTQFQPWYLFWTIPLVALTSNKKLFFVAGILSFASLFRYLPFLYFGDWSNSMTVPYMQLITIVPTILTVLILGVFNEKTAKS